ncbi:GTP-binding protein [Rickettsia canadensis str. McKiel]|uniref:Probable GTP-binding protein EngB n=1 Tax=Rickettsia canadensis (strain McKiel) TaxID=293613 RepID=ENGB_RICCK|nr:ribosome biogenesis GTP-binding protein YihA/YsxC [Rickettsia canadensis]A8EXG4.1 RecName: Full=Probable GTP-binding protein EngB [Rickettsia canadensis str. McKiel]ABV73047.1 GTP-binding protein [Rickettsia canadensis str. McKiel]
MTNNEKVINNKKSTDSSKLFRYQAKFVAGAMNINQIPNFLLPEIAFIGKSNVGKSSLINTICNNKNLAKVSNIPGRTGQINFFNLADKLIIVDLPGYGFANVPISVKEQWEVLISYYLRNSNNLRLVNLLIDSRRGIKENDKKVAELLLKNKRSFQIIFTKFDKVTDCKNLTDEAQNFLTTLHYSCNVMYVSSRSKEGARELKASLAKCIIKPQRSKGR